MSKLGFEKREFLFDIIENEIGKIKAGITGNTGFYS